MITPDNLRTAHHILVLVGLGKFPESKAAAGIIAVRLASLPPEPERWGTPEASSEEHTREAVLDACRTIKAVGWVPDAMTVAILATAHVGNAYAESTRPAAHVWIKVVASKIADQMRELAPETLRDLAGVATVSADETAEELEDRLEALPELAGVNVEVREADHLVVLIGGDGEHAAIACRAAGPAWASWTFTADEDDQPTLDAMAEAPVVHTEVCRTRSAMAESWTCDCSGTLADYRNPDDVLDRPEPKADTGGSSVAQMFPDGGSDEPVDEPVTDPAWEEAIGEICAEAEAAAAAAAQVEAFPTATESRALARTLVDVILDSHGLETGPDGVVRKVDTTVPDEAVTPDTEARVDDLDRYTARVVWQIGDKAGVGLWTTPEEALRDAEAGNEKHGHDTHRVDFDRRVVEKYDEREGWFAVSFDDLRAGDVFRMRERTATEDGPAEVAGCDAYQNERGIWTIRARPMTPIGENPERVAADGATKPIVGHIVDIVSVEDPTPAPKKPRCGLTHGWYETEPPRPMLCNRVQGHKGKCGSVKAEKADGSAQ